MSFGIYKDNGKIKITKVDGTAWTGIYASDGSINIVVDDTSTWGAYHACGALRVNSSVGTQYYDSTGAVYYNYFMGPGIDSDDLSTDPTPGPGGVGSPMGLLLTLTYAA